jgi:hypothetical protein
MTEPLSPAVDVPVVGAGQAGLGAAYWLTRRPWLPFPKRPTYCPTRTEMEPYLREYVQRLQLPVRTGVDVQRHGWEDDGFVAETSAGVRAARGCSRPGRSTAGGSRLSRQACPRRSSSYLYDYRSPADVPPGDVLVVGGGNSPGQLAVGFAVTPPGHGREPRPALASAGFAAGRRLVLVDVAPVGDDVTRLQPGCQLLEVLVDDLAVRRPHQHDPRRPPAVPARPPSWSRWTGPSSRPPAGVVVGIHPTTSWGCSTANWPRAQAHQAQPRDGRCHRRSSLWSAPRPLATRRAPAPRRHRHLSCRQSERRPDRRSVPARRTGRCPHLLGPGVLELHAQPLVHPVDVIHVTDRSGDLLRPHQLNLDARIFGNEGGRRGTRQQDFCCTRAGEART